MVGAQSQARSSGDSIAAASVHDAARMTVRVAGSRVELTAQPKAVGRKPQTWETSLYPLGLRRGYSRSWATKNPIAKFLDEDNGERGRDPAGQLFEFAAQSVGARIVSALGQALIEGRLILSAAEMSRSSEEARDVSADDLAGAQLDLVSERVAWSDPRLPSLHKAWVRRAAKPTRPPDPSGGQSFREADLALVEGMREMIDARRAKNVSDAAAQVAPRAKALGTLDSVEVRLRRLYAAEYPTRPRR